MKWRLACVYQKPSSSRTECTDESVGAEKRALEVFHDPMVPKKDDGVASYSSGFTLDGQGRLTEYKDPAGKTYPVN